MSLIRSVLSVFGWCGFAEGDDTGPPVIDQPVPLPLPLTAVNFPDGPPLFPWDKSGPGPHSVVEAGGKLTLATPLAFEPSGPADEIYISRACDPSDWTFEPSLAAQSDPVPGMSTFEATAEDAAKIAAAPDGKAIEIRGDTVFGYFPSYFEPFRFISAPPAYVEQIEQQQLKQIVYHNEEIDELFGEGNEALEGFIDLLKKLGFERAARLATCARLGVQERAAFVGEIAECRKHADKWLCVSLAEFDSQLAKFLDWVDLGNGAIPASEVAAAARFNDKWWAKRAAEGKAVGDDGQ